MATLSELPFEVSFSIQKPITNDEFKYIPYKKWTSFSESPNTVSDSQPLVIKENVSLKICFQSPDPKARLYLDLLDRLPEDCKQIKVDENDSCYLPANTELELYKYKGAHAPIIPGGYLIEIVTKNKRFYSHLEISPGRVTKNQLKHLREEVNQFFHGLAFDFLKRNLLMPTNEPIEEMIPVELYLQYQILRKNFRQIMSILQDLSIRPRAEVRSAYKEVPKNRIRKFDAFSQQNRNRKHFISVPVKKLDYDLPENQALRFIIVQMIKILQNYHQESLQCVHGIQQEINSCIEYQDQPNTRHKIYLLERQKKQFQKHQKIVSKMCRGLVGIKQASWYKTVTSKSFLQIPNSLLYDHRYRKIYQIYRSLKQASQFKLHLDEQYELDWKRSDLLYEIWGFFQFYRAFEKLGFQVEHRELGSLQDSRFLIPYLQEGTRFIFHRDLLTVHLVYNQSLPKFDDDYIQTDPIQLPIIADTPNNKPDGRADLFYKGIYIGSIIFDLKYRDLYNYRPTKVVTQLKNYTLINSPYLYGDPRKSTWSRAFFSLGIYPKVVHSNTENNARDSIKQISSLTTLVRLNPMENHNYFYDYLGDQIDSFIQQAKSVLN